MSEQDQENVVQMMDDQNPPAQQEASKDESVLAPDIQFVNPTNPMALVKGKALLDRGFGLIEDVVAMLPETRDRQVAITQIESGLLWLRQAVYLEAYAGTEGASPSERRNL